MKPQREPIRVDYQHPFGPLAFLREANLLTTPLGGRERVVEEVHGSIELTLPVESG
jgi:hypothetical protein